MGERTPGPVPVDRVDPGRHVLGRRRGPISVAPADQLFEHEGVRPRSGSRSTASCTWRRPIPMTRSAHATSARSGPGCGGPGDRCRRRPSLRAPRRGRPLESARGRARMPAEDTDTDSVRCCDLGGEEGGCHRGPADVGGADEEDVNVRIVSPGCRPRPAPLARSSVPRSTPARPTIGRHPVDGGSRTAWWPASGSVVEADPRRSLVGQSPPCPARPYAQNPASRQSSTSQGPRFTRPDQ